MAVQNIECQIATVLMKRYLDGDNLPQNLLDDLERHLKACPSCQAILNNEHANIEEVLDGPAPVKGLAGWMGKLATQPATASGFVTAGAGEALMQASYRTQYAPPTGPGMAVLKSPKVLFLSLALAATLIAMSTILRNPSALLGPKATAGAVASYTEPSEKTDEKETEGSQGAQDHTTEESDTEGHSSEENTAEEHQSEESTDPHASSEGHPDHGAEDTHAKADEPKSETHTDANPKTPKFEEVDDPRVPGKPTIDDSELIIAGGKSPQKPPTKTETKTDSHSAPKTAPKPAAKPPAKSATKSTTKPRTASRPRTTTSKPKSTPAKKPSGGGITVYDENGKPIKS